MGSAQFKEVMSRYSDEELKFIVICGKDDYQPLAILAAEEVLKTRNVSISQSEIEQLTKEYLEWKEQAKKRKEQEEKNRKQSLKKQFKIWLVLAVVGGIFSFIEKDITILFLFAVVIPLVIKKFSIDKIFFFFSRKSKQRDDN